jgi:hypothetical protein
MYKGKRKLDNVYMLVFRLDKQTAGLQMVVK